MNNIIHKIELKRSSVLSYKINKHIDKNGTEFSFTFWIS